MSMTGNVDRVEVITSVQRRRRWSAEDKARIVQETYAPGMSVSLVARQHGWRAAPALTRAQPWTTPNDRVPVRLLGGNYTYYTFYLVFRKIYCWGIRDQNFNENSSHNRWHAVGAWRARRPLRRSG